MNRKTLKRKLASMNIQRTIAWTKVETFQELKKAVWEACKKEGFEFVRVGHLSEKNLTVAIYCKNGKQRKGEFLVRGWCAKDGKLGEIYACDLVSDQERRQLKQKYSKEHINALMTVETQSPGLSSIDREEWQKRVNALMSHDNPYRK